MSTKPRMAPQPKVALLVIGHGSRAPEATRVLQAAAASLQRKYRRYIVEASYFEINAPDVQTGIDRCVAQGASRILLVPFSPTSTPRGPRSPGAHHQRAHRHPDRHPHRASPRPDPRLVAICADRVRQGLRAGRWS